MDTTDTYWRPYAHLDDIKVGDQVQVGGSFNCMKLNDVRNVHEDNGGRKFIVCGNLKHRRHYLDDEALNNGYLIGIYKL